MDFSFPKNLDFNMATLILGIYLIVIGILYYVIFHKHHKKNKVELNELVTLVTKFYSLTMLSTLLIYVGVSSIIMANSYKDERSQVIMYVLTGIAIISATIINYIFYIKRNLKDYDPVVREATKKRILQIGEILEFIFFTIFILMPIWQIPRFTEVIADKKQLVIELVKAFTISIASIILMISINPIDIKEKIANFFNANKFSKKQNSNTKKSNRSSNKVKKSKKQKKKK